MDGQRFDAKGFGRVVAAIENIDAEFLGHGVGPMGSFAGDEGVNAFIGGFFKIPSCSAGDDADSAAGFGSAWNEQRLCACCALKSKRHLGTRNSCLALKSQMLAVIEKERAQFL